MYAYHSMFLTFLIWPHRHYIQSPLHEVRGGNDNYVQWEAFINNLVEKYSGLHTSYIPLQHVSPLTFQTQPHWRYTQGSDTYMLWVTFGKQCDRKMWHAFNNNTLDCSIFVATHSKFDHIDATCRVHSLRRGRMVVWKGGGGLMFQIPFKPPSHKTN